LVFTFTTANGSNFILSSASSGNVFTGTGRSL
jgi:hypothetical protein